MVKAKKPKTPSRSNDEIRRLILQYFYDRNKNATSAMGKKGSAIKISDVKKELKASHGLSQQEVQSNLTYLISEGWVEEKLVEKEFVTKTGTRQEALLSHNPGAGWLTWAGFHKRRLNSAT